MLRAFRFFSSRMTSSILSPEEIMSSTTIISLPSMSVPRNSWARMGLRPSMMRV